MRSSRNKLKKIIAIFVVLIFLGIFWIIYSKLLVVNKITWNLNGVDCVTSSILDKTINLKGDSLFKLNNQYIEQTILSKYPCVKSTAVTKDLNGNVVVTLVSRQPFINLVTFVQQPMGVLNNLEASASTQSALVDYSVPQTPDSSFLADDQGVIFKTGNGAYHTVYVVNNKFKIGDHLDTVIIDSIKAVVASITELGASNLFNSPVNQMKIKTDYTNMIVLTDPIILFSLNKSEDPNKDIYNSLISLQLILKTAKMENKTIKSVDLRFDKPVVEYK